MQDQGIDEQRRQHWAGPLAAGSTCRSLCTGDATSVTDQHPHDVLLCIGTGKTSATTTEVSAMILPERRQRWRHLRRLSDAMQNTVRIAERCNVVLPKDERICRTSPCRPAHDRDVALDQVVREGYAPDGDVASARSTRRAAADLGLRSAPDVE
jgi:DNA polymerase III alpha subunit